MWLWQHKNIHKRHLLWLKFFSVCLFFHLTFLSWVFFIDHDASHTISVSLHKHMDYSAPILFVPFKAQQLPKQNTTAQPTTSAPTKKVVTPNNPIPAVPLAKKTSAPATILTETKPALIKKVIPTTIPTKTSSQPPLIKAIKDKSVIAPAKKEVTKKIEPEQQKNSPEKSVPPAAHSQQAAEQPTIQQQAEVAPQRIIPENAHVSDDYREVEAMRRTALLQKELINNWKPPVGMPASTACEISFTVDNNGAVKTTTMVKGSGIIMYDLSARHALFAMKMPQWTHGKTLTINFKQ